MPLIEINLKKDYEHPFEEIVDFKGLKEQEGLVTKNYTINSKYGVGDVTNWELNGLVISISKITFNHNVCIRGGENLNTLLLSIMITGEKKININDFDLEIIQEKMESCFVYIDSTKGSIYYKKGLPVNEISIRMSNSFITKHQLNNLINVKRKYSMRHFKYNSSRLSNYRTLKIINEISLDKSYGLCKRLFLESKVLELLSIQFTLSKSEVNCSTTLKKVHFARDIVINNLNIQYSVKELSKKIFLNELVLKKKFKAVFGVTIFEFTKNRRIEEAKKMLSATSKPIYEISELLGYKNPTHFSAAFKKQEKITPKQFRLKSRL